MKKWFAVVAMSSLTVMLICAMAHYRDSITMAEFVNRHSGDTNICWSVAWMGHPAFEDARRRNPRPYKPMVTKEASSTMAYAQTSTWWNPHWVLTRVDTSPEVFRPLAYQVTTNYMRYAVGSAFTNVPAAIVRSVTWGRGTNALFVLKTQEVLPRPKELAWEWFFADTVLYQSATWIEGITKETK